MAGIIFKAKFVPSGSKAFGGWIDYIGRDEATTNENRIKFTGFADYMANDEKTYGLFLDGGNLVAKDKKNEVKKIYKDADENGSNLFQFLFSFETEWLEENGLYDPNLDYINEAALRRYTSSAMNRLLDQEEFGNPYWTAAIHHNTKHTHIHIAMVEQNVSSEIGEGRCRVDEDGAKYQRGKLKPKTIQRVKSKFAEEVIRHGEISRYGKTRNALITDLLRYSIIGEFKDMKSRVIYAEFGPDFDKLLSLLPEDRRLWRYNMNALKEIRPQIDALTDKIIQKYFPEEKKSYENLLEDKAIQYRKAYGNSAKMDGYKDEKMKDLYSRFGNAILKEMVHRAKAPTIRKEKTPVSRYKMTRASVSAAIYGLQRLFRRDFESMRNLTMYEQFEREAAMALER